MASRGREEREGGREGEREREREREGERERERERERWMKGGREERDGVLTGGYSYLFTASAKAFHNSPCLEVRQSRQSLPFFLVHS